MPPQESSLAQGPPPHASDQNLQHVIREIRQQLETLRAEHCAILKRIALVRQTLNGLADVFGGDLIKGEVQDCLSLQTPPKSGSSRGLTEACRQLLIESTVPLTVHQLCRQMQERYPQALAGSYRPAASLSVILRRLVDYGEAQNHVDEKGTRTWRWAADARKSDGFRG